MSASNSGVNFPVGTSGSFAQTPTATASSFSLIVIAVPESRTTETSIWRMRGSRDRRGIGRDVAPRGGGGSWGEEGCGETPMSFGTDTSRITPAHHTSWRRRHRDVSSSALKTPKEFGINHGDQMVFLI